MMTKPRLNIKANATDWRAVILSNLAQTPFFYGGYLFPSVESALQGIKFKHEPERLFVFGLDGKNALKNAHNQLDNSAIANIYWNNELIEYNSDKHRLLLAQFIGAKVFQNPDVQRALLETSEYFIYHDVGLEDPATSLPEKILILTLIQQRQLLQKLRELK